MNPTLSGQIPQETALDVWQPANLEAEQALLGALLYDNSNFDQVAGYLQARHFFEPLHQRLYDKLADLIRAGRLAEPVLIAEDISSDAAFKELGGIRYLADLVDRAPPSNRVSDYAQAIYDLAMRRDLVSVGREISNQLALDPSVSARDAITSAEKMLLSLGQIAELGRDLVPFRDAASLAIHNIAHAVSQGGLTGIPTGISAIDQVLGGLETSDLVIITAQEPGNAAQRLAKIAIAVARHYERDTTDESAETVVSGGIVAFFSLETSSDRLAIRLLSELSGVPAAALRKGDVTAHQFGLVRDAAVELRDIPIYIDDAADASIDSLFARARKLKNAVGLHLIIVDELYALSALRKTAGGSDIASAIDEIASAARSLGVPVLVGSKFSSEFKKWTEGERGPARLPHCQVLSVTDSDTFFFRDDVLDRLWSPDYAEKHDPLAAEPSVAEIIRAVTRHFDVSAEDLVSEKREKTISRARQVAMWLAKQLTSKSLWEIAQEFNRDHVTAIYAIRRIEELRYADQNLRDSVKALMEHLTPRHRQGARVKS